MRLGKCWKKHLYGHGHDSAGAATEHPEERPSGSIPIPRGALESQRMGQKGPWQPCPAAGCRAPKDAKSRGWQGQIHPVHTTNGKNQRGTSTKIKVMEKKKSQPVSVWKGESKMGKQRSTTEYKQLWKMYLDKEQTLSQLNVRTTPVLHQLAELLSS